MTHQNKRRHNRKCQNQSNKIYFQEWIQHIRSALIIMEEKNVRIRCKEFESAINQQTIDITSQLCGKQIHTNKYIRFKFELGEAKMKQYLSYIYKWKGLKYSTMLPKTKREYYDKARNWLNGRRSKVYGNSLFCDMIRKARSYAEYVSNAQFCTKSNTQQTLCCDILIYSYLSHVCSKRIKLHKSMKKSYLISEHSLKSKCETKQLIQQNASNYSYSNFPTHRAEAVGYFQKHLEIKVQRFQRMIYSKKTKNTNGPKSAVDTDDMITKILNGENPNLLLNTKSCNSDIVQISKQSFTKIVAFIETFNKNHFKLQNTINKLQNAVQTLETNTAIQSPTSITNWSDTDVTPSQETINQSPHQQFNLYLWNDMDTCMSPPPHSNNNINICMSPAPESVSYNIDY